MVHDNETTQTKLIASSSPHPQKRVVLINIPSPNVDVKMYVLLPSLPHPHCPIIP